MINIVDKKQCCGCSSCFNICPKQCIKMTADEEGFLYPSVDTQKCIDCSMCERVCPMLHKPLSHDILSVFAAKNKNDQIRMNSSSGGMFTEFAKFILNKGGLVFGAAFDEKLDVVHCCITNESELYRLQGSKYVQSSLNEVFKEVKAALNKLQPVLFSGTPCQIAGLKAYLQKDYQNLYTVDVVCHGVPSPMVYRKYLAELGEMNDEPIYQVKFRDKTKGWKKGETLFFTKNNVYGGSKREEPYMKLFLNNVTIRPSCSACAFNNKRSMADVTIADFWGIEKFHPEVDDDKGTTLIMVNTVKGNELFDSVKESCDFCESSFEQAAEYNVAVSKSLNLHEKRKYFFENCPEKTVKELFTEILPEN